MKKTVLILMSMLLLSQSLLFAQEKKVTDLPDISVIGNFVGSRTESKNNFNVQEIEFAFQHYLYPSVKANVFTALHKESNKMNFELEEAYVDFSDITSILLPNSDRSFYF